MEKILFTPDGEEEVEFYVLEQTKLGGSSYILVTDQEEGDGEALILRDISDDDDQEAVYVIVDEEKELSAVASVFENLLEDIDLE